MTTWEIERYDTLLNIYLTDVTIKTLKAQDAFALYTLLINKHPNIQYRLIRYDRPNSN
jgi:hypothetical protein